MKFALNVFLVLFTFVILDKKSFSLSDYKIKKICEKEKSELNCIKNLQKKKSNMKKGLLIEIPVIPFKGN
jgi:hypothetical protein